MTFNHRGRDITDQLDSNQFKYDPQRGLVIDRGTMVYHTGLLVCEASKGGKSNSYKAVLQFIPVEQPKTPSILEQGSVAQSVACNLDPVQCCSFMGILSIYIDVPYLKIIFMETLYLVSW